MLKHLTAKAPHCAEHSNSSKHEERKTLNRDSLNSLTFIVEIWQGIFFSEMIPFKPFDIIFVVNQKRLQKKYSLKPLSPLLYPAQLLHHTQLALLSFHSDLQSWCSSISWLSPVQEKACHFLRAVEVSRKPHQTV